MNAHEATELANKKYLPRVEKLKNKELEFVLNEIKKKANQGYFYYVYKITPKKFDAFYYIKDCLEALEYRIYSDKNGLEISWHNKT